MLKSITILFICLLQNTFAQTTYYVSNTGNDANNGTSTGTSWQTVSKVNSHTFSPGDQILFKRGDTFVGSITVNVAGVTYDAYGTGGNPVITGLQTVSGWTSAGTNLWQSTSAVSSLSTVTMVLVNGVEVGIGRTPNIGSWYHYQSYAGNYSITSTDVNKSITDWTGAKMILINQDWTLDRCDITSTSGSTLNFTNETGSSWDSKPGNGFFICDDIRTLDQQNEWYYNPSNGILTMYSTTMPTNVQVANVENLIKVNQKSDITIQNLTLNGSNGDAIYAIDPSHNGLVHNNIITNAGNRGIYWQFGSPLHISNNYINNTNYNGIDHGGTNVVDSGNTIINVGMITGMTASGDAAGIFDGSNSSQIIHNLIRNVAGTGINSSWTSGQLIQYNWLDSVVLKVNDHGAMYSQSYNDIGRVYDHNIITYVPGNISGLAAGAWNYAEGYYMDSGTSYIAIKNSTISGVAHDGIKHWYAHHLTLTGNTSVNNKNGLGIESYSGTNLMRDNIRSHNIFFAKNSDQSVVDVFSTNDPVSNMNSFDSNYYAKPIDPSTAFSFEGLSAGKYDFSGWQSISGMDVHSSASPLTVTDTSKIKFLINPSLNDSTISLAGKTYQDAKGNNYSGSITIHPYESAVLIETGTSTAAPTVSMSGNQTITVSSTSVYATATWASGHTGTYQWTLVSGTGSITSPTSSSTGLTGLSGTSVFRCTITQDDGQTAYGEVTIIVNTPPTANAGSDVTITLPVNSVALSGSGTDSDGTIASYSWSKISGGSYSIDNANIASPTLSNLVAGTYIFRLTVTDNQGATGTDDVTIIVNVAPTASVKTTLRVKLPYKLSNK